MNIPVIKQPLFWSFPIIFLVSSLFMSGCFPNIDTVNTSKAPSKGSASACIDVRGKAYGDAMPNATVYLFATSKLKFGHVMKTVRQNIPIQTTTVNRSKEFVFFCLDYGRYIISVPSNSYYNESVGSPVPYEMDSENVSVTIAYTGGDYAYMVSTFRIENKSTELS